MLKVFQRIEVWVLLALCAGAAWFVLKSSSSTEKPWMIKNETPATSEPAVIRRMVLVRDHSNGRLDLEVRLTNRHPKVVQLVPPFVMLKNGLGREVPAFFLPVEPPPSLPAGTTADVRLRFWLDPDDFKGPLTLELDGARLDVKSAAPFDLGRLENDQPAELTGPEWAVKR